MDPQGRLGWVRTWLAVIMAALLAAACAAPKSELPEYGAAPAFTLMDQQGQTVSSDDLRGRVALVSFIYTSCTDVCPMISASMQRTQERLKAEGLLGTKAVLLSITVDPVRDTPPVLAAYADRFAADPANWRFLTGNPEVVRRLVHDGFKQGVEEHPGAAAGREIVHGGRIVLVDSRGQVRAYLPSDAFDVEGAVREVKLLAASS